MSDHWWIKMGLAVGILDRQKLNRSVTGPPAFQKPLEVNPFKMESALDHLVKKGFFPQVVLDVGAAKGYWSEVATFFFPKAQFYLLEPLKPNETRLRELCGQHPNLKYLMCAAGEMAGEKVMNVTPDLDGSSLLSFQRERKPQDAVVKIVTIDSLLENGAIQPPQFVKMDVQGYELKVLQGGQKLFDSAEVFIMEVSLYEFMPGCPLLHEVVNYMAERGYVVFDVAGFLKRPYQDDLAQVDLVFVKKNSALVNSKQWA